VIVVFVPIFQSHRVPMAKLFYILSMFVGTMWFQNFQDRVSNNSMHIMFWSLLILAVSGAFLNYQVYKPSASNIDGDFDSIFSLLIPWIIAYLVFMVAIAKKEFFGSLRFFAYLGSISYSLYLLHPLFMFFANSLPFLNGYKEITAILICFSTVIASIISYQYIELPMIRSGKNIVKYLDSKNI
jgi:peptidoglycan/LPS O-acetylase OafA/YrhL